MGRGQGGCNGTDRGEGGNSNWSVVENTVNRGDKGRDVPRWRGRGRGGGGGL